MKTRGTMKESVSRHLKGPRQADNFIKQNVPNQAQSSAGQAKFYSFRPPKPVMLRTRNSINAMNEDSHMFNAR